MLYFLFYFILFNSLNLFIEKLNKLDTKNIEPLTSVAETTLKFRNDEVIVDQDLLKRYNYDEFIPENFEKMCMLLGLEIRTYNNIDCKYDNKIVIKK